MFKTPNKSLHNIVEDHDLNGNTARCVPFEETYARGTEGFPTELSTSLSSKVITASPHNDSEESFFYQGKISTEVHSYRNSYSVNVSYSKVFRETNFSVGSYAYSQKS
jgi:hypothetical protein